MPATLSPRRRANRFRPEVHSLEERALLAIGQITLSLTGTATTGITKPVIGDLPGGLIELDSFNSGAVTPVSVTSGPAGVGAGKVSFAPLVINTIIGRHTPGLFLALSSGAHFTSAQIIVRDDAARILFTYNFGTVFVTQHEVSAAEGDFLPPETDTLKFGSLQVVINDPNTNKMSFMSQWNQITNTPTVSILGFRSSSVSTAALPQPQAGGGGTAVAAPAAVPTTVKLTAAKAGNGTRLTAKVSSAGGTPTGSVAFYNGKTSLGLADVGADGTATITVAGKLSKSKLVALYSGGPNSRFATGSSVTAQKSATLKLFQRLFNRPMDADEWMLTSLWLQQGTTLAKLAATYKRLATRN